MARERNFVGAMGRILLSVIFLLSGVSKLMDWNGTAAYMQAKAMPAVGFFLAAAIAVEILGGLSLLLGMKARLGATLLFLYLIPTTLIFHNFWGVESGPERMNQMLHFLKNLTIMGGLLVVASVSESILRARLVEDTTLVELDRREVA
jgi:putative oxidoreductase